MFFRLPTLLSHILIILNSTVTYIALTLLTLYSLSFFAVTSDDDQSSNCFTFTNFKDWTRRKAKRTFTKKLLYKRLPILRWLPQYNRDDAIGDLVAGITVGLTVIPQALAYSGIAGLPAAVSISVFVIYRM